MKVFFIIIDFLLSKISVLTPILLLLANHSSLYSQNIIKNYSFETFSFCPRDIMVHPKKDFIRHWYNPSMGTPDYYNKCSNKMGVPNNIYGNLEAYEGGAYIALILRSELPEYREYIQSSLKQKMKKGELYCISFYSALADYSVYITNRIGILLTKDSLLKNDDRVFHKIPSVEQSVGIAMNESGKWYSIKGTYKAKGGENFVTIGNFYPDNLTPIDYTIYYKSLPEYQQKLKIKAAYYFFDDIKIFKINKEGECSEEIIDDYKRSNEITYFEKLSPNKASKLSPGQNIILSNIMFELNKAKLLPESFNELDRLVMFLINKPSLNIEVNGHTDNTGEKKFNDYLSKQRAKSVKIYLMEKGIDNSRIEIKGYGSRFPIDDNNTIRGRALNRRVEFRLLRK